MSKMRTDFDRLFLLNNGALLSTSVGLQSSSSCKTLDSEIVISECWHEANQIF